MQKKVIVPVCLILIIYGCSQLAVDARLSVVEEPEITFHPVMVYEEAIAPSDLYVEISPVPTTEPTVEPTISSKPKVIAREIDNPKSFAKNKISATQFVCLDKLWTKESNWNPYSYNKTSGAYGIPQAVPGSKMASAGGDWKINPITQVKWGLSYIKARYETACNAWSFWWKNHWY